MSEKTAETERNTTRELLEQRHGALQELFFCRYTAGGVAVEVETDDAELLAHVEYALGTHQLPTSLSMGVRVTSSPQELDGGNIVFDVNDPAALTPEDLLLGIGTIDFPFRLLEGDSRNRFAWREDDEPLFTFEGPVCWFRKRLGWRTAVGLLILHRVYRLRRDAIFFHASTIDIGGAGVMFIGPKGRGKSTSALALAARGHALLGDETGCYVPASHELEPFRRPVGIKPGPRSRTITDALTRTGRSEPDDVIRVELDRLIATPKPERVALCAVIFLQPFADEPRLTETGATPDDVRLTQPVSSCFVNAPRVRRVFELARMLSLSRIFRLAPGDPDRTADLMERVILGGIT